MSSQSSFSPGAKYQSQVEETKSAPNEALGFELSPTPADVRWSFAPEYYPDSFTQMKKTELSRYGGNCGGESVSIKSIKNREFHVSGVLLEGEIELFHGLQDYDGRVDVISPLIPRGGMESIIKKSELGDMEGYSPHYQQWMFKYRLDLVSTGRDEHGTGPNGIVSKIIK